MRGQGVHDPVPTTRRLDQTVFLQVMEVFRGIDLAQGEGVLDVTDTKRTLEKEIEDP